MWEIARGALTVSTVQALRLEAEALSRIESPSFENGCVLEPLRDDAPGDAWRVEKSHYISARKVAASADLCGALFETVAELACAFLCSENVHVFNEHYVVKPAKCDFEFGWHADGALQLASCPAWIGEEYVSCWCALDEMTEENGCLILRSGSRERAACCNPGDVVLFSSHCEHRSGPNLSDAPRRAYYAQYSRRPIGGQNILRLAIPCRLKSKKRRVTNCLEAAARRARDLSNEQRWDQACEAWLGLREKCWATLHNPAQHWRKVPSQYRRVYAVATYNHVLCMWRKDQNIDRAVALVNILDLGLMIDDGTHRASLLALVEEFEQKRRFSTLSAAETVPPRRRVTRPLTGTACLALLENPPCVPSFESLATYSCFRSLDLFRTVCFEPRVPAKIANAMAAWPALSERSWSNLAYLRRVAGHRLVPVEVGAHYLDDAWVEKLMTLSEFIDNHVLDPNPSAKGYLAQHALFDQIPALRRDIALPEYIALSDEADPPDPRVNAWFGPSNTVSPLHHDRYHNLLCQVVGVNLYSPSVSERLYPRDANSLHAVSSEITNIDDVDDAIFPLFNRTPYADCYLAPGDMLYIPPHTWHYIEACETSFSVSIWWT